MDIIGHTSLVSYLVKQKEYGTLSHAYLFVGPQSVGKRTVADWFISQFPNCERMVITQQGEQEDTDDTKTRISIKIVRAALARLSRSTFDGAHRFMLIDNAELLTEEASNALLKKLEEPPQNTIFLFIAPSIFHVLPTIASRCQHLRFTQVSSYDMRKGLLARGIDHPDTIVSLAAGLPGRALQYSTEGGEALENKQNELDVFFDVPLADRLLQSEHALESLEDIEQYIHRCLHECGSHKEYARACALYARIQQGYRHRLFVHSERIRDAIALI
ncbi:hypothetical protein HY620_02575 [Candidatus Uhrbacteria bacterium]|nr:hypothetical protein [Candidatus Uhrbacteria bacterium]